MFPAVRPWGCECPSQKGVWALHDGNMGGETKMKWKEGHWLSYIFLRAEGQNKQLQHLLSNLETECWDTVFRKMSNMYIQ